ncbi:tRNA adenosine deaminase-associated protein [Nocardiopsis changdeensis]|uniref:tRNA adenosine deaminase-associated protein n=1 Tax=Nocardiopsis changdeensis TaxID=2831969 RepID=A0ABX8BQR7_9ACTN|nr:MULTISPECIES: tRNA adenosine deaminase-associated protein [Nocardiopsis]QUX22748.1 tRNA adenosine deaminase-associated protein [Nocardiopsis changdeensis]QYX38691.1 tRNA adenosine deaminase-associated protein [Nocardiopsis sp. MT53]
MSTFAAVFAPDGGTWRGTELELGEVDVVDDVTELTLDFATDTGAPSAVLLVEVDDEWFAIVRAYEDGEPRVYLSDARAVEEYPLAEVLAEAGTLVGAGAPDTSRGAAPGGDAGLLEDFGVPADELRSLSVGSGVLPSDVLAVVADRAGFGELLDGMRL